jgi:hypothetical protein
MIAISLVNHAPPWSAPPHPHTLLTTRYGLANRIPRARTVVLASIARSRRHDYSLTGGAIPRLWDVKSMLACMHEHAAKEAGYRRYAGRGKYPRFPRCFPSHLQGDAFEKESAIPSSSHSCPLSENCPERKSSNAAPNTHGSSGQPDLQRVAGDRHYIHPCLGIATAMRRHPDEGSGECSAMARLGPRLIVYRQVKRQILKASPYKRWNRFIATQVSRVERPLCYEYS